MGWEADRMLEDAQEWADFSEWCPKHRIRYLPQFGCLSCEDGDPPVGAPESPRKPEDRRVPVDRRIQLRRVPERTGRQGWGRNEERRTGTDRRTQ